MARARSSKSLIKRRWAARLSLARGWGPRALRILVGERVEDCGLLRLAGKDLAGLGATIGLGVVKTGSIRLFFGNPEGPVGRGNEAKPILAGCSGSYKRGIRAGSGRNGRRSRRDASLPLA